MKEEASLALLPAQEEQLVLLTGVVDELSVIMLYNE